MSQLLSTSVTRKKGEMAKWIRDRVDYSREAEQKPYTFHRDICFLDCQLPCLATLQPQLRTMYIDSVVDEDMKMDLENCRAINWLSQAIKLIPVNVPRDGNCLLHAASMAVWGVEDSRNTLRDLMLMTIKINPNFKKRWWSQLMKDLQSLKIDESEIIEEEWDDVIRSISDLDSTTKSVAVPHRFLEGIHIYIVANILRRPIIVVTNSTVRSVTGHDLQENHIGGVYLPLEWAPLECCKTPIILGYNLNHFCPLLTETQPEFSGLQQQKKNVHMFPLVTSDLSFLLVRYLKEDEDMQAWDLVQSYLLVKEVETRDTGTRVPFAQMQFRPLDHGQNLLFEQLRLFKESLKMAEMPKNVQGHTNTMLSLAQQRNHPFYDIEMNSQTEVVSIKDHSGYLGESKDTSHVHDQVEQQKNTTARVCITEGCGKQGSEKLNNMCFHCYRTQDKNVIKSSSLSNANTNEGHVVIPTAPPAPAITPTAPPLSLEPPSNDPPLSMMVARCTNGCGYRCSNQTFPYCHECYQMKTKESEQNVTTLALGQNSMIIEFGTPEGATVIHDTEASGIDFMQAVLSSSPASSSPSSSELSSSEPSWLLGSGNANHLFSFPSDESNQPPKSGSETLMDQNCKHFDHCSGVKMLDQDICFSCAQNEKSARNTSENIETETQLPGDQNMIIAEENSKVSLGELAASFAETNAGSLSGDIEVSSEPTCKVECPYCRILIFPQEKLCSTCMDILDNVYQPTSEYNKEINSVISNTASKMQSNEVIKRSLEDRIFSGKVSLNLKTEGKLEDHNKALQTALSFSKPAQFVSAGSKSLPTQGKRCTATGCSNYGDPVMDNKCSSCYYKSNPWAKPKSPLVVEKRDKAHLPYPKQGASEKLCDQQLIGHSINSQSTDRLFYSQKINRPAPLIKMHSSGAITVPVRSSPHILQVSESNQGQPYSLSFAPYTSERSLEVTSLSYPITKDVMVTSKTGHNSSASLHPLDQSSLQVLPQLSSYSFNPNPDKSFERTFQTIEVEAKKKSGKCLTPHCVNYGNSYKKGYCNSCFKVFRTQMILEREAMYGMDVPDSMSKITYME